MVDVSTLGHNIERLGNLLINTASSSLKGKVVLLYIWTYTCINSIRPMPYIDDWNQKYSDKGLVVVGVHSPEFQFEKKYTNVKDAVQRFGIRYPVILDSDHGICAVIC